MNAINQWQMAEPDAENENFSEQMQKHIRHLCSSGVIIIFLGPTGFLLAIVVKMDESI